MEKKRQVDIDILRGLAILSVVWYHMGSNVFYQYFASFHMILFFCVSGYCYKSGAFRKKDYIIKKIKSFLRPYLIWCIFYTFVNIIIDLRAGHLGSPGRYIMNLFLSNLNCGAIWFLLALFITTIVGALLIEYVKPNIILVLCSIAISIIGLVGSKFAVIDLFRWEQALFCVPAFVLGYLFKDKWREKSILTSSIMYVAFFAVGILCSLINGEAVLSRMAFGKSFALFYFGALCSTFAWFLFSNILFRFKVKPVTAFLSFLGEKSLVVLITHQFVIFAVGKVLSFVELGNFYLIVAFAITVAIEFLLCYLSKYKYFAVLFR